MVLKRDQFFIITGAPGTGKTTLIDLLRNHYPTQPEPARMVIQEQKAMDGDGIWEKNTHKFVNLLLTQSISLFQSSKESQITFFDRGIPDCMAYASYADMELDQFRQAALDYRYNPKVFFLPPWENIYHNDEDRQMNFQEAIQFSRLLSRFYLEAGYDIVEVPKVSLSERLSFIIRNLPERDLNGPRS